MKNEIQYCYQCGKTLGYINEDDCWSTAFHLPFDSLQKIKKIMKNNCICQECLSKLIQKVK